MNEEQGVSAELRREVDENISRFEAAWARGESPAVEVLLPLHPQLREWLLEDLSQIESGLQRSGGTTIAVETYVLRFPGLLNSPAILASVKSARPSRQGPGSALYGPHQAGAAPIAQEPARANDPNSEKGGVPQSIGQYEILGEIARGGMGIVYRARHRHLGRTAAVKLMRSRGFADHEEVRRFLAEAEAASQLDHPGIVPIYEAGMDSEQHFIAMAFVDGQSLWQHVKETPLEPREAARLLQMAAEAVQYAHTRGIVHRDLKPQNILLSEGRVPRITDFGLAKRIAHDSSLTATGQIVGTPAYMSPEQAAGLGDQVGPLSDVYALGATLYCLLTGRPPFQAATPIETLNQVLGQEPVSPRELNPAIPRDLETICLKAAAKAPAARYGSAQSLADDLRRFLDDQPIVARPVGLFGRLIRWSSRNRAVAALMAVAAALLLSVAVVASTAYFRESNLRQDLEQALTKSETSEAAAKKNEVIATRNEHLAKSETQRANDIAAAESRSRDRAEGMVYASQIKLAQVELDQGNPDGAHELLQATQQERRGWEYRYLRPLVDQARLIYRGTNSVECVAFSPDGKRIASGCWDSTIKIWDAQTGQRQITLKGHKNRVHSLSFSHDGKRIVTGGGDKLVRVWDAQDGTEIFMIGPNSDEVTVVAFSPDDTRIAATSTEQEIRIWDAKTGKLSQTLGPFPNQIFAWSWFPDNRRIVLGTSDQNLRVIDLLNGREVLLLKGHTAKINCVTVSPDSSRIISGGWDNTAIVWNSATGERLHSYGHVYGVLSVACSPDGSKIATGTREGRVNLWESQSGKAILSERGHNDFAKSLAFNPSGTRLVSGSWDTTAKVWDTTSGKSLLTLDMNSNAPDANSPQNDTRHEQKLRLSVSVARPAMQVVFSPNGEKLAAAVWDGTARVYNSRSMQLELTLKGHSGFLSRVAISPDGTRIASGESAGMAFKVWNLQSGKELLFRDLQGPKNHGVYGVAFSPDGKYFVIGDESLAIRICDSYTGQDIRLLRGHTSGATSVSYSSDGRRIVSSSYDKLLKVWDAETGIEKLTLRGHSAQVWASAISPDGMRIASASWDKTARIWNVETGEVFAILRGHTNELYAIAYSPDGRRIATGSADNTIKIWDARNGQELITLRHSNKINSVTFSPDGRRLASASDDAIIIWDPSAL